MCSSETVSSEDFIGHFSFSISHFPFAGYHALKICTKSQMENEKWKMENDQ